MQTNINNVQWMIAGEAGFGIKVTGQMFARACIRAGLQIFDYTEYPSLVRGGHNAYQVVVGDKEVFSQRATIDVLVALNDESITFHKDHIAQRGGVMIDADRPPSKDLTQHLNIFAVPLSSIAKEAGGSILMRNVVALGASFGMFDFPFHLMESVIHTAFDRKGEDTVASNIAAAKRGYEFAHKLFGEHVPYRLRPVEKSTPRVVMNGNNAISLGAIAAGCGFFAGYPMTPVSGILAYLAKTAQKTGMVVRHAEDEIGAINEAIGASYTGARSMVATAGGGYSLMVEATGLAAMVETPLVIVEGQRPGPSTGLPTWTGQADLQFILHAGQDEFPRIVLAPGDAEEAFYATAEAFNLADRFQTPVFVLTDKYLAESHKSITPLSSDHIRIDRGSVARTPKANEFGQFARYAVTSDGISPRTFPGTPNGTHTANSDEHNAYGVVDETSANRVAMMQKRMQKLVTASQEVPLPKWYGPEKADVTILCWGSTKGPALAALQELSAAGASVNVLHFVYLEPLPADRILKILRTCTNTLLVEGNASGQFGMHLKQAVGFVPEAVLHKFDGRPFYPHEIVARVRELL